MTRLLDLPVDILECVCEHSFLDIDPEQREFSLMAFTGACSQLRAVACPIFWRNTEVAFGNAQLAEHTLQWMADAVSMAVSGDVRVHASRHTKVLIIDCAIFDSPAAFADGTVERVEKALVDYLDHLPRLTQIIADFGMPSFQPDKLIKRLFNGSAITLDDEADAGQPRLALPRLESLTLAGLHLRAIPAAQPHVYLRHLVLELSCCHDLDLALFPHLSHLRLELFCQDSTPHSSKLPAVPATLWSGLRTLVFVGTKEDFKPADVLDQLSASLSAAPVVSLEAIGIFWELSTADCADVLVLLRRFAPHLRRLAWGVEGLPMPGDIEMIAQHLPDLQQLSLIDEMSGDGEDRALAQDYAKAFGRLPNLRSLGINCAIYGAHVQVTHKTATYTTDTEEDTTSSTPEPTDTDDRQAFARLVADQCPALQQVVFMTDVYRFEQAVRVRTSAKEGCLNLFWERC